MVDNNLNSATPLRQGQVLTISCLAKIIWSPPYASCGEGAHPHANAMSAVPAVHLCPSGQHVTNMRVQQGNIFWVGLESQGHCVGLVSMICSGGNIMTIDVATAHGSSGTVQQSEGNCKNGWE